MGIKFQRNILKYLFQNKIEYLEYLNPEIFDTVYEQEMFKLLYNYIMKYKNLPDKNNFKEYVKVSIKDNQLSEILETIIDEMFIPLRDTQIIEERLISDVKRQLYKNMLISELTNINSLKDVDNFEDLNNLHNTLNKITNLNKPINDGLYLLKNLNKVYDIQNNVYPTFLQGLNNMLSLGGFHPPQIVVIMGAPKSFKTGLMIKFGVEYMKDGLDVYYADFENSQENIHLRAKQCLLECELNEISSYTNELNLIREKLYNVMNSGDLYIKKFLKRKDHFGHIETDLNRQIDNGLDPKLIIYDYINIMGCSDISIKDPRLKIQHNYAEAQSINDKYKLFCLTVSKMSRLALEKEWPTADDVAEDFEIIYNAHAVFALMRGVEDIKEGIGRLIPIAQRQGVSYEHIACTLNIEPSKFIIQEL